mgnify:CR=1 FL=1
MGVRVNLMTYHIAVLAVAVLMWVPNPAPQAFSLTVSRSSEHITLRYPTDVGEWREVCVITLGEDIKNSGVDPAAIEWREINCWSPYYRVEEHKLKRGAYMVWAILATSQGGVVTEWFTPRLPTRPR